MINARIWNVLARTYIYVIDAKSHPCATSVFYVI